MLFEIDVINKTIILKSPVELKDIEKIFSEILIGWQDYKIIQDSSYHWYTLPRPNIQFLNSKPTCSST